VETTPRSSISSQSALLPIVVLGIAVLLVLPAEAGRGRRGRQAQPEPEPVVVPQPVVIPTLEQLFPQVLPLDPGAVPEGIANGTSQACAACHYTAADQWADSAHAGPHTVFFDTINEMGMPACGSCHRPIAQQWSASLQHEQGDASRPVLRDNGLLDLTLQAEGVTCAACHVRDGSVIATSLSGNAPHAVLKSPELGASSGCASCHQLTLPDASAPLYDTYGEWERSPWAEAGIGCIDCHVASATDGGLDHTMPAQTGKGLSISVRTAARQIVRGGDAIDIELVLQNVGAGHALPTGSPFVNWQLAAWVEGPPRGNTSEPDRTSEMTIMLARTLTNTAPFAVQDDTRLAAFEQRAIDWSAQLDLDAEQGDWSLVVELSEKVGDTARTPALRTWRFPIVVR
jgi:nitrate/TMAO reductase-like tetraheme cytochrome c subunit